MQKRYVVIAIGLVAVLAVVVLATAFVRPGEYHNATVEELKARASEIEARYHQHRTKNAPVPETDVTPAPTETTETASPSEDPIEAYNKFSEKQVVIDAKQALELLFEDDEEKSYQEFEEELAAFCADNQAFIEELRNIAATGGPFSELDLSSALRAAQTSNRPEFRYWVRVLKKNGAMATAKGDYETAVKDALAIANFAEGMGKEPLTSSKMMREAYDGILYHFIEDTIPGENLSPEQAARIIEYAARFNGRNDFSDAIALESSWMIEEMFTRIESGRHDNSFLERFYGSIGRPLLYTQEEIYVDIIEQFSEAARLPFYQAQPELERIQEEVMDISYIHFIVRFPLQMTIAPYCTLTEFCARSEAQMGLMQIGLTVEQYHAQHGGYPQTLEEIAPALGGTLPIDPYTGESYVYKPHGDNFTLYSARGSIETPGKNPRGSDENGNIVWRYTGE